MKNWKVASEQFELDPENVGYYVSVSNIFTSADGDSVVKVGSVLRYSTLDQPVEASQQYQAICQECGESDDMGAEILIPCKMCKPPAKHRTPI
ncbi:hypothetical protein MKW98_002007 [Papaver atlanticum]|uniref:Uncharacterized protein n=1 Tax=Papaver atlanticum TaxID=357466 RepID=A0AAD4SQC3_9MAGN|nr:hypothetical protein MKW98_002007 [Papaver atlanticum]